MSHLYTLSTLGNCCYSYEERDATYEPIKDYDLEGYPLQYSKAPNRGETFCSFYLAFLFPSALLLSLLADSNSVDCCTCSEETVGCRNIHLCKFLHNSRFCSDPKFFCSSISNESKFSCHSKVVPRLDL